MRAPSAKRILALSLVMLPTLTWAAESLPANVRACTAEADRDRRLACFDREVARFPDPQTTSRSAKSQPAPGSAGSSSANIAAAPPPAPAPAAGAASTNAPANAPAADKPGHFSARVVSIEHSPNEMVLHLDNGQAWQQQQAVVGDLSLKTGDSVTIDKRLGSYWLTGPHVSGMKVRQAN
jgi:hypothetical protein